VRSGRNFGTLLNPTADHTLAALRRLREHAAELRAVLRDGDPQDQRKVFTRTVRTVKWLPDEEHLEIRLRLPHQEEEEPKPQEPKRVWILYVPGVGFEPTRPLGPVLLRHLRLPFRHPGVADCRRLNRSPPDSVLDERCGPIDRVSQTPSPGWRTEPPRGDWEVTDQLGWRSANATTLSNSNPVDLHGTARVETRRAA
jgi:hypothetical protein